MIPSILRFNHALKIVNCKQARKEQCKIGFPFTLPVGIRDRISMGLQALRAISGPFFPARSTRSCIYIHKLKVGSDRTWKNVSSFESVLEARCAQEPLLSHPSICGSSELPTFELRFCVGFHVAPLSSFRLSIMSKLPGCIVLPNYVDICANRCHLWKL